MSSRLKGALSGVEFFTFGFGTMVGVGWLVLIDDWLGRGGPAGAALGFAAGGLMLFPIALTYGRLVRAVPDAGAEIAYAEGVLPRPASFAAAWTMVLAYAIVCPWEAVAAGNLLARAVPWLDRFPLYALGGKTIFAPRLLLGLALTAGIALLNYRGIRLSGLFQDATTFALLAIVAVFVVLGFARGSVGNTKPVFARPGLHGAGLSVLLVLQIVPYFLTGFESVAKGSEEARPGFSPQGFSRAIAGALSAGIAFYATIVVVTSYVFPWKRLVAGHVGTEGAFERAFGSATVARLIVLAAFFSLLKVFNGNFVAATRLLFGIAKRGLVPTAMARVHPAFGTPVNAVVLMAALTAGASLLGDALLVPVTEVGSLASGVGWLSACVAFLLRTQRTAAISSPESSVPRLARNSRHVTRDRTLASAGVVVSLAIVAMKVIPPVPGSFTAAEWLAFAMWSGLGAGLFLTRRRRGA